MTPSLRIVKPHDPVVESAYLAVCMLDPTRLDTRFVEPEAFADARLGRALAALYDIRARGEDPNTVSLRSELLRREGRVDDEWLLSLTNHVPLLREGGSLAAEVRTLHTARGLRGKLLDALEASERGDVSSALALIREMADARDPLADASQNAKIAEVVASAIAEVEAAIRNGARTTVETGIAEIDKDIGGMEYGDMWVIGGDTSVGKSSLALLMAMHQAKQGHKPGIVSMEDPKSRMGRRLLAATSGVSATTLRKASARNTLSGWQWDAVGRAIERVRGLDVHFAFRVGEDLHAMAEAVRTLVREHGCDVVYLDYIQAVEVSGEREPRLAMRKVLSTFKRELNAGPRAAVGVALSQFRKRDDENERPTRADLYESHYIAQKAEGIVLLWKSGGILNGVLDKSKDDATGAEFIVERDSRTGVLVSHKDGTPTEESWQDT